MRYLLWALLAVCISLCIPGGTMAQDRPLVIVKPQEIADLLANPGMGWQTFHRTSKQDKTLPDWIPSTVHYARWGWGKVEPKPGEIDTAFLDRVLKETRESGQTLAFRVMCCATGGEPYHPKWLREVGGREIMTEYEGQGPVPVPDLDDPVVLERHLDFIRRLGERYDGHPDIDHVDLGSVGWWGEWHMSGSKNASMPKPENQRKIVDAYFAAFRKTPLIMLMGGGKELTYATQKGAGWRADCLGDLGGFSKSWCHMRKGYPHWIREAGVEDAWKTGRVAWESCWDMRRWVKEDWSLRFIFNYALACHGSYLNNKSQPLPEGQNVRPEVERFLRRLGYRLVLKELSHAPLARAGEALNLSMKWQNVGSAPCYRPYRLAYRLSGTSGEGKPHQMTIPSQVAVNQWMPGSIPLFTDEFFKEPPDLPLGEINMVNDTVQLPGDLPAGEYTLSIGIVNPPADKPVVKLAIEGRDAEGWYPLSRFTVAASGN